MYIPFVVLHAVGGYLSWLVYELSSFIILLVSLFSSLLQIKSHCTTVLSQPPRLQSEIPFVGHLLRIIFEGTEYLRALQYVLLSLCEAYILTIQSHYRTPDLHLTYRQEVVPYGCFASHGPCSAEGL